MNFNFVSFSYNNYLPPQLVPELIATGAGVYIEKERKKKSNANLQLNYNRYK